MRRRIFPNMIGDVAQLEERQERMERVMQMLGVTPEYPYTFNVNDGTFNRVRIGLIGADYGIQIVDNAGNSILLANGTIVANAIKTGTLDCSLLTVTNLNAGSITTGTLSASYIQGGTLNCSLMTVQNLNAGSITVGTFSSPNNRFTDESLSGVKISQNTIYGNRIIVNTVDADRIKTHTITANEITAQTITTNELLINGVNADRLVNESITNAKIANATITNAKINDLSASKINAGTMSADRIYGGTIQGASVTIRNGVSNLIFQNSGGGEEGRIYGGSGYLYIQGNSGIVMTNDLYFTSGKRIYVDYLTVSNAPTIQGKTLRLNQNLTIDSPTWIGSGVISNGAGQFAWWNGKTAIIPTKSGYRALYCMEAPEVWFMDFCETKDSIDPMFLEVTEGEMKFIKCDDGTYQVWRRRKGVADRRFDERSEREYKANNVFWNTPKQMAEATEFVIPIIESPL